MLYVCSHYRYFIWSNLSLWLSTHLLVEILSMIKRPYQWKLTIWYFIHLGPICKELLCGYMFTSNGKLMSSSKVSESMDLVLKSSKTVVHRLWQPKVKLVANQCYLHTCMQSTYFVPTQFRTDLLACFRTQLHMCQIILLHNYQNITPADERSVWQWGAPYWNWEDLL